MTKQVKLRQEQQSDFSGVFKVNRLAFEQEDEARLVDALRENDNAFVPELSIVATKANNIVGHILFTKISIEDNKGNLNESLALAPMAVIPELQQKGIGGELICKGFKVAKRLGFKSVIVLGHKHYYPKFGFKPADKWNIEPPFEVSSNAFMAKELVANGLENVTGKVRYPKEFETV